MKKRRFFDYTIFFMVYAMIGWIYEVVLEAFIYHNGYINRGILFGPWLPVYGFGSIVFLLLWYRIIKGKTTSRKLLMIPVIFLLTMATATLIELITSYLCEWIIGSWPWQTYAEYKYNFQARIALSTSIRFGLGGVAFLYVVQPFLDILAAKLKDKPAKVTAIVIISVLVLDLLYTIFLR